SSKDFGKNNGKIYLSCRDGAEAIGVTPNTIYRRYAQLEHYGFLRKTTGGCLTVTGRGVAPHYRFTDLMHGTHAATRDYEQWDGVLFETPAQWSAWKKQNPVAPHGTPRLAVRDIERGPDGRFLCRTARDIEKALGCLTATDISRIAIPHVSGDR